MNNQALPRSHSFKLLGASITENIIWHVHVSSIATAAGKKLRYLFRAIRKYFSPSNLLTLYKAQIILTWSIAHIPGELLPLLPCTILDAVQRRAIRLIADPALACNPSRFLTGVRLATSHSSTNIQTESAPPSWLLFFRRSPSLTRCTRGTYSSHSKAVVLHTSRTELYDRTLICPQGGPGMDCLVMYLFVGSASVGLFMPVSTSFP
nr:unnamed protein product [Callosobruchus chinensis]